MRTVKFTRIEDALRAERLSARIVDAVWAALDQEAEFSDLDVGCLAHEVAQCFRNAVVDHLSVDVIADDTPVAIEDIALRLPA